MTGPGKRPVNARSVLVVSDEWVVADVIGEVCRCSSASIEVARSNCEAVASVCSRDFDVIYVDLNRSRVDGVALCNYIGVFRARLLSRVVVIVGGGEDTATHDYLREANHRILKKPFALKELLKTLPWPVEEKDKLHT